MYPFVVLKETSVYHILNYLAKYEHCVVLIVKYVDSELKAILKLLSASLIFQRKTHDYCAVILSRATRRLWCKE